MIAAYKNYQRRLKEYRMKLMASKANVNPNPQAFPGAVTHPPRPGVNAFAQPQPYRGYYRPEALAAQNVQINRAYPQAGYGVNTMGYPNQFGSPYGYQAVASSPYYRSKMGHGKGKNPGKLRRPAPRPAALRNPAYNRQPGRTRFNSRAAYYYKQQHQRQQQFQQTSRQQYYRQPKQQRQQFRQKQPQRQYKQEPQQLRQFQQEPQQQQQFLQEAQQLQQQQQQQRQQQSQSDQQTFKQNEQPQPVEKFPLSLPEQPSDSPSKPSKPDTSALKDLKADIESAIQDALRNAVTKSAQKTKPSEEVHVDGERAKPQIPEASPEQAGSGSGVQTQNISQQGSVGDAVNGEAHSGSGSGLKPESRWRTKLRSERHLRLFQIQKLVSEFL